MHFLDEPTVRRILAPILRDQDTAITLLTHAHPLPFNQYVFAERWIDESGNTYLIDTEHILRAMDTPPRRHNHTWTSHKEERNGIQRLRLRAETLITTLIPNFILLKPHLHPFEAHHKKILYTFRWERTGNYSDSERIPSFTLTLTTQCELVHIQNALATYNPSRTFSSDLFHTTNELFASIEFMQKETKACTTG